MEMSGDVLRFLSSCLLGAGLGFLYDGFRLLRLFWKNRAAVFVEGRVLLARENNGTWALPGGWCDVLQSVGENAVKETREEAGLEVAAESIIAVQDRARHNRPDYAYGVCKVFVLCRALGGSFRENIETVRSDYFPEDALPPLSEAKNTPEQVHMCFAAYRAGDAWKTQFD